MKVRRKLPIITCIILVCAVLLALLYTDTGLYGVSGMSMYPTLHNGDLMFVAKNREYEKGSIVVLNSEELGSLIVKRVIGTAGDYVQITNDGLFVNNSHVSEVYVYEKDWYRNSAKLSVSIPDGYIFVMGDNRNGSYDSRDIGLLPVSCVYGLLVCDLSNYIGLSAFGFKAVAALCLLLLFAISYLYSLSSGTRKLLQLCEVNTVAEDLVQVVEEQPKIIMDDPIPPMSTRSALDVPTPYWKKTKDAGKSDTMHKE